LSIIEKHLKVFNLNKRLFSILCCYLPSNAVWLIAARDARFLAGRAVSNWSVNACGVFTCPAAPAGVSQSAPINLK
jgi:hypothetical protein